MPTCTCQACPFCRQVKDDQIAVLRQRCRDILVTAIYAAEDYDAEIKGINAAVADLFAKTVDVRSMKLHTAEKLAAWLWERGVR